MSWDMILTYIGIVFTALAVGSVVGLAFSEALTALGRRAKRWSKDAKGTTSVEYAIVLAVVVVTVACASAPLVQDLTAGVGAQAEAVGQASEGPASPATWATWR